MSHFTKLSGIKFTDITALKEALKRLGVEDKHIQVAQEGKKLTAQGYGSQTAKGDIVVKGAALDSSTDIYFSKDKDGVYSMVGDTYTLKGFCRRNQAVGQGAGDLIAQAYSYEATIQKLQEQGFSVDGDFVKNAEGSIELQAVRWG